MARPEQTLYFERRAAEERTAAEQARDERAAQPHRELAQRYEEFASGVVEPNAGDSAEAASGLPAEFAILP